MCSGKPLQRISLERPLLVLIAHVSPLRSWVRKESRRKLFIRIRCPHPNIFFHCFPWKRTTQNQNMKPDMISTSEGSVHPPSNSSYASLHLTESQNQDLIGAFLINDDAAPRHWQSIYLLTTNISPGDNKCLDWLGQPRVEHSNLHLNSSHLKEVPVLTHWHLLEMWSLPLALWFA